MNTEVENPDYLFRYMPAIGESSYAADNIRDLLDGKVRMTGVLEVNDPFDSSPQVSIDLKPNEIYEYLKDAWKGKTLPAMDPKFGAKLRIRYKSLRELKSNKAAEFRAIKDALLARRPFEEVGFSSWSEVNNHPLMWSHYSSSHQGVCIKLNFGEHFPHNHQTFCPIVYSKIRPERKWTIREMRTLRNTNGGGYEQILTKAIDWEYEKEWRLFGMTTESVGALRSVRPKQFVNFSPTLIESIILGCNVCKDTEALVLSHLKATGAKVSVLRASLCSKSYEIIV